MTRTDIIVARMLLSQLGYEMNANEVERRYSRRKEIPSICQ
jgi:hypothetical protein